MRCDEVRTKLVADDAAARAARAELAVHLAGCAACRDFSNALDATRLALRERQAQVPPPPGFATRVVARLPTSTELLGWAAVRLLPAALVLLLALSGFGLLQPPPPTALLAEPSPELLLAYTALAAEGTGDEPSTVRPEPRREPPEGTR